MFVHGLPALQNVKKKYDSESGTPVINVYTIYTERTIEYEQVLSPKDWIP